MTVVSYFSIKNSLFRLHFFQFSYTLLWLDFGDDYGEQCEKSDRRHALGKKSQNFFVFGYYKVDISFLINFVKSREHPYSKNQILFFARTWFLTLTETTWAIVQRFMQVGITISAEYV